MDYPIVIHQWKDVELSIYLPTYIFICMKKTKQKNWHTTHKKQQKDYKILFPIRKKMEEQYVIWFDRIKDPSLHAQNCQNIPLNEKMITSCDLLVEWSKNKTFSNLDDFLLVHGICLKATSMLLLSLTLKKDTFMKPFQKILHLELVQFNYPLRLCLIFIFYPRKI